MHSHPTFPQHRGIKIAKHLRGSEAQPTSEGNCPVGRVLTRAANTRCGLVDRRVPDANPVFNSFR